MTQPPPFPDFRSQPFLTAHIQSTLNFYLPHCVDLNGGFFHHFRDDGTIYNHTIRHLVSSTRFVFNFASAGAAFNRPDYLELARHGLRFIEQAHTNPQTGGYAWILHNGRPHDDTNHCYGLAFVLLAYAAALKAGIGEARTGLDRAFALLEARFWDAEYGLYRDEYSRDWQLSPYRGQNANMHSCEALLAAYEATGDDFFLQRAYTVAENIAVRQAALSQSAGDLIWEHYTDKWQIDWEYNKDNPQHRFRPWGFQPGHQTEWAKLLLILERYRPADWQLGRAEELFKTAVSASWDPQHGGLCYGLHPNGGLCDSDKYYWVQAETIAAAALLAQRTDNASYWQWYDTLWRYSWHHFIDHQHGAWYRILSRDNRKYSDEKSPAGKTDYHTIGACFEILRVL
ncbi:MAG: AGE family epimerase/isomerase [Chloroflexota bacterium]